MSHKIPTDPRFGNTITVDAVNGDDVTGKKGRSPFKTINAAIAAATTDVDLIQVYPGTYEMSAGITLPSNTTLRGAATQAVTLQMTNVTSDTTLLTMGDNCRVEDVALKLTSAGHHTLVGIEFPGTTSITAKLRPSTLTVDNTAAGDVGTSNVYGVLCNSTGDLGSANFSFNCLKGSTITVKSAGGGKKRGVLVNAAGAMTARDMNIFASGSSIGGGSFVGIETLDAGSKMETRATTIYGSTSDIRQTSGSITLGPGTDLALHSAGGLAFSTFQYPTVLYYGTVGSLSASQPAIVPNDYALYLTPGAAAVQPLVNFTTPRVFTVYQYPDSKIAYYSMQQKSIVFGLFVTASIGPTNTNCTSSVFVMKNGVDTALTATLIDGIQSVRVSDKSIDFNQYDLLSVRVEVTGSTNTTHDLIVQLDTL